MARRTQLHGLEVSIRTGCPVVPRQEWGLTRLVNGERITVKKKVLVHTFTMGDVEDPYLYAAFPLHEWEQTEHGKWIMEHSLDQPTFYCDHDPAHYGYRVAIYAVLGDRDLTYFELKYGGNKRP
jgi:hypothetical protein